MTGQKINEQPEFLETPLKNRGGELREFTLLPGPAFGIFIARACLQKNLKGLTGLPKRISQ